MSQRSGNPFRRASARDLRVLVLGILLVITGVVASTCGDSLRDAHGTLSGVFSSGGDQV